MRVYLMFLAVVPLLVGQPRVLKTVTVQPGKAAEIELLVPSPRPGDAFDILSSDTNAYLNIVLPDGHELAVDTQPPQQRDEPVFVELPPAISRMRGLAYGT
jgi:hypothetical protein